MVKRTYCTKPEWESTLVGNDELYWEMDLFGNARGKIVMDKPQSVRPSHHENDPCGSIVDNIADLYNLSADA